MHPAAIAEPLKRDPLLHDAYRRVFVGLPHIPHREVWDVGIKQGCERDPLRESGVRIIG
jgi:hypothetical protein